MTTNATRTVTFRVIGIPQPKGSTRAFKRGDRVIVTSDNPRIADWQHAIATVARTLGAAPFVGAVAVAIVFRLPRPKSQPRRVYPVCRPDLDKLARGVFDALIGILIADDSAVVELVARKYYADTGTAPCAEITVSDDPFAVDAFKPARVRAKRCAYTGDLLEVIT